MTCILYMFSRLLMIHFGTQNMTNLGYFDVFLYSFVFQVVNRFCWILTYYGVFWMIGEEIVNCGHDAGVCNLRRKKDHCS